MTSHKDIVSYLESQESHMFVLLEELVRIQSGSYNKKGVDQVAERIAESFADMQVTPKIIEQNSLGNHLIVRSHACSSSDTQILFVGHMDTVFPADTEFNWYKEDEDKSYGPGVIDMKGGLVVGIFALKALNHLGFLEKIPITFLFNSDEEIGSRTSLDMIQREANQSALAFVLEAGGPGNKIVTGRKGNLSIEIQIAGEAGHAAFAPENKASAILEMAHKTVDLEALNDFEKGITINVGKVEGGIGSNTVPELANALVDFRYIDPEDLSFLERKVSEISRKQMVHGTECRVDFLSGRPPMEQSKGNRKLFKRFENIADSLGYTIQEEFRFGVSDANFIADLKVPVLDGLGPIGLKDHSRDEYMIKESLLQRTILLACGTLACWDDDEAATLF
jgi:glutamate carboxypeptidase